MLNESYYKKQFSSFEAKGGKFRLTWNWAAFFFGGIWQLFRGLYVKFFLYGLALYFLELMVWKIFGPKASFVYPIIFFSGLFVYGIAGNYDFYLKKVKGENLWPAFSFKHWRVRIPMLLLIGFGMYVFFENLSENFFKGFRDSNQIVDAIDQAIERELHAACEIQYEVHLSPTRNVYDLDIQLSLKPDQIFDIHSFRIVEEIVRENLASFGEIGRVKTYIIFEHGFTEKNEKETGST